MAKTLNLGYGLRHNLCDHSDCIICLRFKYERLVRIYDRSFWRADRRQVHTTHENYSPSLWLDAIDLRTRLARAKLNAWHAYESEQYNIDSIALIEFGARIGVFSK